MGLDISISLIVGVPLSALGTEREEEQRTQTTDRLGRPTGESVVIRNAYFDTLNDLHILIGSNEQRILNGDDEIEYTFSSLLEDNWIHAADWEQATLDDIIVGLRVTSEIDSEVDDRHAGFEGARIASILATANTVQEELSQRFGYTGEIYTIALASYSY